MNRESLDTVRERERESYSLNHKRKNNILNIVELIDKIGGDRKIHLLFCVMQN